MKKLIALVITLMTIVTLSASAQCPSLRTSPRFYGDFTPCKNQKNVTYSLGNYDLSVSGLSYTWCPSSAFSPTQYRWNAPYGAIVKDAAGNKTGVDGFLYTTSTTVWVDYKTKGGTLGCYVKDECGTWVDLYSKSIYLTCDPGTGDYPYVAPVLPDTGRTVYGADVTIASQSMTFAFDSVSFETGPYTYLNLYKKCPSCTCASNFVTSFSDGYYQQIIQTSSPTQPINIVYGYNLYYPAGSPTVFRMGGVSLTGGFYTLPFTIGTTIGTSTSYPVLPTP
jgi:hypothetical protein